MSSKQRGSRGKEVSFQWITANLFENRKSYSFLFGFPADRVLVCQPYCRKAGWKNGRGGHLFNNNLLCLLVHFFPVLFLPINFCLISTETGQKVIITADPTEVKNVIIKLGWAKPSGKHESPHTPEEGQWKSPKLEFATQFNLSKHILQYSNVSLLKDKNFHNSWDKIWFLSTILKPKITSIFVDALLLY